MIKKLSLAIVMMATMGLGTMIYERAAFAQNSNSSTVGERHENMRRSRYRRHRRMRRHRHNWRMRHRNNRNSNR